MPEITSKMVIDETNVTWQGYHPGQCILLPGIVPEITSTVAVDEETNAAWQGYPPWLYIPPPSTM